MENQDFAPSHIDESRPSIGFPLGTALLLIIVFCLSGFFSCCYHWDKLRSLRSSSSQEDTMDPDADTTPQSPSKSKASHSNSKQLESQSLPVLMPGDEIPRFIALPCPREPLRPEKLVVKVEKPPRLPVPLY